MLCRFFGLEKSNAKESGMKLHGNLKDRESWHFQAQNSMTIAKDLRLMKYARIVHLGAVAPKRYKQANSCPG